MTPSDLDLLQCFARDGAQDAFAELVRRQVNLVYSAALRQVRSPQLAEEIAQSVFTDLARDAGKLQADTVLTAWLHAVTRRTAIDVIRKESRRQLREQIAHEMNITNAPDASWSHIEPLLDEAVAALDETDRAAILLRYFENKSLRDVGRQLGVSDDTAQKRVSRAVEKLREFFTERKITIGAGGLVGLISANAVQSAPVGLAVSISAAALAGTAATTSTVIAATTKTIAMTALQKSFVVAAVAALAVVGIYEARQAAQLREQNFTLQQAQALLVEQIQQLQRERDDATNRLAVLMGGLANEKKNNLELLGLRGRVTQLANQLERFKAARAATEANSDSGTGAKDADTILCSASLTNRVVNGHALVVGGWSMNGLRSYLVATPIIIEGASAPGERKVTVQSQIISAPESFWNQIGWAEARTDKHSSTLAFEITPEQLAFLTSAVKEIKGAGISNDAKSTVANGALAGVGFSVEDDSGKVGALLGIDIHPWIAADGQSVDLELRPSKVSAEVPIHPLLKSAN